MIANRWLKVIASSHDSRPCKYWVLGSLFGIVLTLTVLSAVCYFQAVSSAVRTATFPGTVLREDQEQAVDEVSSFLLADVYLFIVCWWTNRVDCTNASQTPCSRFYPTYCAQIFNQANSVAWNKFAATFPKQVLTVLIRQWWCHA